MIGGKRMFQRVRMDLNVPINTHIHICMAFDFAEADISQNAK